MLWAISRVAAPKFAENREKGLQPHVDYLRSQKNILVISGATTSDDGKQFVGSLLIVNVKTRAEAVEWTRKFPNPTLDGSDCEIEVRQMFELGDFGASETLDRFRDLGIGGGGKGRQA